MYMEKAADVDQAKVESLKRAIAKLEAAGGLEDAKRVLWRELMRLEGGYDSDALVDQDVDDVTTSAFEAGIANWCNKAEVIGEWPEGATFASETLTKGAKVWLHDFVGKRVAMVDDEAVRRGIVLRAAERGMTLRRWIEEHDALEADCAIQYAAFGEIVYG